MKDLASGIALLIAAAIALLWANSPWGDSYHHLWDTYFSLGISPWDLKLSLHHWINDGLMAIFFFLVGHEIKRELVIGELSTPRQAALPMIAALGGMVVPALIYHFLNPNGSIGASGWGIPMATDIAFAVGVLALGRKIPTTLKIFLLALAIVDDLGAVLVIAVYYTKEISSAALAMAALSMAIIGGFRYFKVQFRPLYVFLGLCLWLAVFKSGVHATIAGVLFGLLTPAENHFPRLQNFVNFAIMPIFALANAGVTLDASLSFASIFSSPVALGVGLGLMLGKPIGIAGSCWIAVKTKQVSLPRGVTWRHIIGIGFLGGIGFTMALFISELALLDRHTADFSKLGILLGSLISAILGLTALELGRDKSTQKVA